MGRANATRAATGTPSQSTGPLRRADVHRIAIAFACSSLACRSAGEPAASTSPRSSETEQPAAERSETDHTTTKSLVGRWQLIKEEPADGRGGFFEQERRTLHLDRDGGAHVENAFEAWDGTWRVDGAVLRISRTGSTRVAIVKIEIAYVNDETLVLLERLPEIYQQDGPPRQVRNTYRRVRNSEFGPMLGTTIVRSRPRPGAYSAAYTYRMSRYPTREVYVDRAIEGRATLELSSAGVATACFGVADRRDFSESEFASQDGTRRSTTEERRWLAGARGVWSASGDEASITLDRIWNDRCDTSIDAGSVSGSIELKCTCLARNEALPLEVLACRLVTGRHWLNKIAVNPADTERAGPFALQREPRGDLAPNTGRPWLLLGATPGLRVRSTDERGASSPIVEYDSGVIDFDESRFATAP